jgi:hypothetical protein
MAKLTPLQKLLNRKERLEASYAKASSESTRKFSNLGWGHGMRCSKINISFTKEDRIKEKLREVEYEIESLTDNQ